MLMLERLRSNGTDLFTLERLTAGDGNGTEKRTCILSREDGGSILTIYPGPST